MSHAIGAVKFKNDNKIMYYEYDGTADVVLPQLHKTADGVSDNWRKGEWVKCKCESGEDVEIMSTYGRHFYFDGKACRKCMAIISPLCNEDFWKIKKNGTPDWSPFEPGY